MASFHCYDNSDVIATLIIKKISSLSNTTGVAIFPNLRLWRRSLYSNLGRIDPEKLYQAELKSSAKYRALSTHPSTIFFYPLFCTFLNKPKAMISQQFKL